MCAPERHTSSARSGRRIVNILFGQETPLGEALLERHGDAPIVPLDGEVSDLATAFDNGADDEVLAQLSVALITRLAGTAQPKKTTDHNGPLFTDNDFHNTGVPAVASLPADTGRAEGALAVQLDPFNCLGEFSDAKSEECMELKFMKAEGVELVRAFKAPSLRDVADRAPFLHAGQVASLADVVAHYNNAPGTPAGHSELVPLNPTAEEQDAIVAFLRALDGAAPPS